MDPRALPQIEAQDEAKSDRIRELRAEDQAVRRLLGARGLLFGPDSAAPTPVLVERLLARVEQLAKAVVFAHVALDLDMGDGEPTFQCCRTVCGHSRCPVGDALDLAMRISPLTEADVKDLNAYRTIERQAPVTAESIAGAPGTESLYRDVEALLQRAPLETWREALSRAVVGKERGADHLPQLLELFDTYVYRGGDELRAAWFALYEAEILRDEPATR